MAGHSTKYYSPAFHKSEEDIPMESVNLNHTDSSASYFHNDDLSLPKVQALDSDIMPSNSIPRNATDQTSVNSNNLNNMNNPTLNFPTQGRDNNPYSFESQRSLSNSQPSNIHQNSFDRNSYNPSISSHPSQHEPNHVYLSQNPAFRTDQLNESSDKNKFLGPVPEEASESETSDDEEEELVDLGQVVDTLKSKNLTKQLNQQSMGTSSTDSNTLNSDYDQSSQKGNHSHIALLNNSTTNGSKTLADSNNGNEKKRRGFRQRITTHHKKKKDSSENKYVIFFRQLFVQIYHMSLAFRCLIFWFPLALVLFIPLSVGAWGKTGAEIGHVPLMWIFIWLEVVWGAIFVSLIVAHILPNLYYFVASIIAPGLKKYRSVISAMHIPITMVFSALIAVSTFMPVMTRKKNAKEKDANYTWQKVIQNILVAVLISSLIYCAERFVIHLISVSFHKKRFSNRIKDNKRAITVLSELLFAACTVFPPFCAEFIEEDLQLQSGKLYHNMASGKNGISKILAKNKNVQRIFGKFNHAVDVANNFTKSSSQLAPVMDSVNDLKVWCNNMVTDAMSSKSLAQVLATRIWMSLVLEDENSLTLDDLVDVLGPNNKEDYEALFQILDEDGNGNLTLEEMKSATRDIARERKSIYKSLKDVDSAIAKLHSVLLFIIMIIIVIVFIGMLAPSVTAVLATLGTTILGLSFVFATTCQEICASCVFLFVKHPIDVGDRVNILTVAYVVREISLLSTVFTRVSDNSVVQAPNSILNTLWIDNISRSGPQCFNMDLTLGLPETSFEQLHEFNSMLDDFCLNNSRDYAPEPFFYITSYPELDRVNVTVIVTFKSNFADGMLYSRRRSKLLRFLGRCINELNIHIPRREDTSTDPGLPSYYNSLDQLPGIPTAGNADIIPFTTAADRELTTTGKRTATSGFPQIPLEYMDSLGNRRARMGFAPEKIEDPVEIMQEEQEHFDRVFADEEAFENMEKDPGTEPVKCSDSTSSFGHGHKPSIIPEEAEDSNEFKSAASTLFPNQVNKTDSESAVDHNNVFTSNDSAVTSGSRVGATAATNRAGRSNTLTVGRHDTMQSRRSGVSNTNTTNNHSNSISNIGTGINEDVVTGRRKRADSMASNGNLSVMSPILQNRQNSVFSPQLQMQLQNHAALGLTRTRSERSIHVATDADGDS